MKRLYLLRHGQTEFNVKKLVQGRCDSPLTDLGRHQAQTAAAWLKAHGVVPDKVVSSPLGRAMDTAQLVATELLGADAAAEPLQRHHRALLRHLRGRPARRAAHRRLGSGRGPGPLRRRRKPRAARAHGRHPHQSHGRRGHRNPPSSKPRQRPVANSSRRSPRGLRAPSKTPQLLPSWSSILTIREKRTIRPNASSPCNKLWIPNKVIS